MATEFHLFSALPYEIRSAIWELCLPHRVEEIEPPIQNLRWPYIVCALDAAYMANRRPPAISRVCRESRTIVLKTGESYTHFADALRSRFDLPPHRLGEFADNYYVPVDTTRYQPSYTCFPCDGELESVDNAMWTQPGRLTLHLNHTEDHQDPFDAQITWELEEPVAKLLFRAKHLRATSVSIMADLILPFCENNLRIGPVIHVSMIRALRRAPSYNAVVLHVPVHLKSAVAARQSGLFGLLGDAPLQLVNPATDWARIEQFKALWLAHGEHLADRDAVNHFLVMLASEQGFLTRCRLWCHDVEKVWVNRLHDADGFRSRYGLMRDEVNEADDMPKPDVDSVWTGRNDWPGRDADWDPDEISAPTRYWVDIATRSLNKENPWVQAQLAQMPQFVPHVMFRYCDAKCYLPEEERPKRPIKD
ncbi:hypothetical protein SBRCBS47491_010186 [Sporothrix bragantina]|uniref:2EXR domain-containing protein n=1 Tax=Sporothrix bragantina TaxID=671064 RepID=A0ABP0D0D9_9PEZI